MGAKFGIKRRSQLAISPNTWARVSSLVEILRGSSFDIAQGFTAKLTRLFAPTLSEVLSKAAPRMGSPFDYFWNSHDGENWNRCPSVHLS